MQFTINMPIVNECDVNTCAYNTNNDCHALAITIGEATGPRCDTFFESSTHAKHSQQTAGVGACKVTNCRHNENFECSMDAIRIGYQRTDIHCLSYAVQ